MPTLKYIPASTVKEGVVEKHPQFTLIHVGLSDIVLNVPYLASSDVPYAQATRVLFHRDIRYIRGPVVASSSGHFAPTATYQSL